MKVALCSAFDQEKDGISDYSGYLFQGLSRFTNAGKVNLKRYITDDNFYKEKAKEANAADIVHIQFNYPYFNGELPYRNKLLLFLKYIRKPVVITMHEIRTKYEPIQPGITTVFKERAFNNTLFFWNYWVKSYHRDIFNRVNMIIVHTRPQYEMAAPLVKDKERIELIPHGIPLISSDKKAVACDKAKEKLGVKGKTTLTIFGFINKKKGYEIALECLRTLTDNIVLLIAGGPMTTNPVDSQYYSFIQKEISSAGLDKRVKITGYLDSKDIPQVMAATDICLAPFLSSSASGALSLCIAYNKAIIASDIEVHKEINSRGKCLELFHQGQSKDLLERINRILANKNYLSQLTEAAKAYSLEFSYAKIAEKTVSLYREAAAGECLKE